MEIEFFINLLGWVSLGILIAAATFKSLVYVTASWDDADRTTTLAGYITALLAIPFVAAVVLINISKVSPDAYVIFLQVFFAVQALFVVLIAAMRPEKRNR